MSDIQMEIAFDRETLDAIEAYRREQTPVPSQSEAVRTILSAWLMGNGYMPTGQEGTHPEDLNASNDG